jgi:hypothetical protein
VLFCTIKYFDLSNANGLWIKDGRRDRRFVNNSAVFFWNLMQFQNVLIKQELTEDLRYCPGFCWPSLTPKIMCLGKEILNRRFGNFIQNNRSTLTTIVVNRNQLLTLLCLLLSNDVQLNPSPTGNSLCIFCDKEQLLNTGTSFRKIVWICDSCIDICCRDSPFDQSASEVLSTLPKGIRFAHVNLCGILNKLDQIEILLTNGVFDVFAVTESKLIW